MLKCDGGNMAKPSISIPDELLEEFDKEIARRKADDELPTTANRSKVIRELMNGWVEGNSRSRPKRIRAD